VQLPTSTFRASRAGFSLIEIVLALGIIAFALVGILGLFPVAVDAAASSQQETQAAFIARSIFDQLEANPGSSKRSIKLTEEYSGTDRPAVVVDLSKGDPIAPVGFDSDGKALSQADDPFAIYRVEISISPITTPDYGLSKVVVTVKSKNTSYPFSSILRQK